MLELIHLCATLFMTEVIWTIQVVQYPLFLKVGPETFDQYHAGHTQKITYVVLPAMSLELILAIALVVKNPYTLEWVGIFLLATIWGSTAFLQVPLHTTLLSGHAPATIQKLVRSNWLRTLAWSLRAVLALWIVKNQMVPV